MEQRLSRNGVESVTICRFGLGDTDSVCEYFPPKGANTGTGSFVNNGSGVLPIRLDVRRGDTALKELNVHDVHFVKIDTEGYEPLVLRGLHNTLCSNRPVVFFEWSQNERVNSPDAQRELLPENYEFFQFMPEKVLCTVFRRKSYALSRANDLWMDGNIVAVPSEFFSRSGSVKGNVLEKRMLP